MSYEIHSENDFLEGSRLIARIPENEIDKNALYTIQADCPDFILPFHCKRTDGQLELTYKIGTHSKLQYFSGEFTVKEYADMWQSLIKPLLECGDWFMNPCSFVLRSDYLYYDKNKRTVSYVYVPSNCGHSGYDAFREMAAGVSKMMKASDAVLENKVLRAIIEDFSPTQFLKMLKDHISESAATPQFLDSYPHNENYYEETYAPPVESSFDPEIEKPGMQKHDMEDDKPVCIQAEHGKKEKDPGGYKMFSGRGRKKREQQNVSQQTTQQAAQLPKSTNKPVPGAKKQADIIDITQDTSIMSDVTGLRYIGHAQMPQTIQITIKEGEMFTIGRFDVSVGKKQSSFEFDKKTKAVSRRHAVIERDANGYRIIDLSSSAGTFINNNKLAPNTPYGLETGFRVSFGNSGADYVWEVS